MMKERVHEHIASQESCFADEPRKQLDVTRHVTRHECIIAASYYTCRKIDRPLHISKFII